MPVLSTLASASGNFFNRGQFVHLVGQQVFTSSTTWSVPNYVTTIHILCVQQGSDGSSTGTEVVIGGTTVCRAKNSGRIGDGGGEGGTHGTDTSINDEFGYWLSPAGGGGAGGYSGNGGTGGSYTLFDGSPSFTSNAPTAGSGGGGGGGGGDLHNGSGGGSPDPRNGGGVGLLGAGSNGTAGTNGDPTAVAGGSGSGGSGSTYGGGGIPGSYSGNGRGGALSYKNSVAVTPGQSVTITIPATAMANGAVRIMYGGGRSYPSTAGDM
jgi:hypothetical protein